MNHTVVSHVRATHRMCGCLTGTLPQIPQQNVFLGLPLELMTEEAALLVENGAAYVVDDVAAHKLGRERLTAEGKEVFLRQMAEERARETESRQRESREKKAKFAEDRKKAKGEGKKTPPKEEEEEDMLFGAEGKQEEPAPKTWVAANAPWSHDDNPHASSAHSVAAPSPTDRKPPIPTSVLAHYSINTASSAVYHNSTPSNLVPRPDPCSYPLYKYLHSLGYFLSPGLRFGCQFMAYPGDPLRFHSHFIARGLGWDEEVDMIDIVGGGRLGTGVKKAWMFGGGKEREDGDGEVQLRDTRVFCVEWGGF